VLVERDRGAAKIIRANLSAVELTEPMARLICGDAIAALEGAARRSERYDLVFLDPPYRDHAMLGSDPAKLIKAILAPSARIVTESDRREPLELELPIIQKRLYGDTLIQIHQI
jgi:16S rRNA G966 N2-methylase RsmD